jgi:hypothetical protein
LHASPARSANPPRDQKWVSELNYGVPQAPCR